MCMCVCVYICMCVHVCACACVCVLLCEVRAIPQMMKVRVMYYVPHTYADMTLVPSVLFSSISFSSVSVSSISVSLIYSSIRCGFLATRSLSPIQSSALSFSQSFISLSCVQGLMQWVMVGMFVFFFGSYAFDLFIVTASPHATMQ